MVRIWLVALFACGGRHEPKLPIEWAPSFRGLELVLSEGGESIAIVDHVYNIGTMQTDEIVRLHEHDPGERKLGEGTGTLVGAPAKRDALIVDPNNKLWWLVAARGLVMPLDEAFRWTFVGGAVDHAAMRAHLVFVPSARFDRDVPAGSERKLRIVEVDTAEMRAIGTRDISLDGRAARDPGQHFGDPDPATDRTQEDAEWIFEPGCTVTGSTAMFLTCATTASNTWVITRYDNLAPTWSRAVHFVDSRSGDTTRSCLDGTGSAVVLAWGSHWKGLIKLFQSAIVDARTGAVRLVHRAGMSGYLHRMVPYPTHSAIAELYISFDGITMLDTSTATPKKLVEWPDAVADKLYGVGVTLRADGTFILGSHDPKYHPR